MTSVKALVGKGICSCCALHHASFAAEPRKVSKIAHRHAISLPDFSQTPHIWRLGPALITAHKYDAYKYRGIMTVHSLGAQRWMLWW